MYIRQRDRLAVAKFSASGVWDKFPEESALILEVPEFPYNTVRGTQEVFQWVQGAKPWQRICGMKFSANDLVLIIPQ